jgi:hypothetical protein
VGDAATSHGIQRITFTRAGKTGHVTVIVSSDTAYIRGDAFVLVNYMGFKPIAAAKYANAWVLIPRSDRDFPTVALGVRLRSTIDELRLRSPLSLAPETSIRGIRVFGVRGKLPASSGLAVIATLYAQATGSPLPVREEAARGGLQWTVTFSRWNESVRVVVPPTAVPISSTGLE